MRRLLRVTSALTLTALAAMAAATPARADLVITYTGQEQITSGAYAGNFLYTYNVFLAGTNANFHNSDHVAIGGDFVTLYDFAGLVSGTIHTNPLHGISKFDVAVGSQGTTPSGVSVTDAAAPNLTFTYNGPSIFLGTYNLGTFTVISTIGTTGTVAFAGQDHFRHGGSATGVSVNSGTTLAPVASFGPLAVPEPSTTAMGALGVVVLAFCRRRAAR